MARVFKNIKNMPLKGVKMALCLLYAEKNTRCGGDFNASRNECFECKSFANDDTRHTSSLAGH